MDLTVTLIQAQLFWEDISANLAMFEEKIWQINGKTDLIVLPEMFSTGFTMNASKLAEPMNSTTFRWMKQMASQTDAAIVGSFVAREGTSYFNRLIFMQPNGKYYQYDKRHLFKLTGEHEVYHEGNKKLIVNWRDWNLCPLVCYDLRFPVWSRNKVVNNVYDYDALIYVANWPSSRSAAWETLLRARAIENSCYTIGSNIVGKDGRGFFYKGVSMISGPLEILYKAEDEISITNHQLIKGELIDYRIKYPFLNDSDAFEINV